MGKLKTHKIEKVELVKVEKNYNPGSTPKFYYNMTLQDIDEALLLILDGPLQDGLINRKIKYNLNEDNVVSEFELS
jgi:hypothetical protein